MGAAIYCGFRLIFYRKWEQPFICWYRLVSAENGSIYLSADKSWFLQKMWADIYCGLRLMFTENWSSHLSADIGWYQLQKMGAVTYLPIKVDFYREWVQPFIGDIGWFLQKMGAAIYLLIYVCFYRKWEQPLYADLHGLTFSKIKSYLLISQENFSRYLSLAIGWFLQKNQEKQFVCRELIHSLCFFILANLCP